MSRVRNEPGAASRRRWVIPPWMGIVLAAIAIAWILHITGPLGVTEIGERTGVGSICLLLLTAVAVPLFLAIRGVLWLKGSAVDRRRELQRKFDACVCTGCGYDLRTLPDQCPECGAPREKWWS